MRILCLAVLALAGCSTAMPPSPPSPPVLPAAPVAGRITDLSAEPTQTLYRIKLPDGSLHSARSAQPFPIGACVEMSVDSGLRESTRCK